MENCQVFSHWQNVRSNKITLLENVRSNKITLLEKEEIITAELEIVKPFNTFFANTVTSFKIHTHKDNNIGSEPF